MGLFCMYGHLLHWTVYNRFRTHKNRTTSMQGYMCSFYWGVEIEVKKVKGTGITMITFRIAYHHTTSAVYILHIICKCSTCLEYPDDLLNVQNRAKCVECTVRYIYPLDFLTFQITVPAVIFNTLWSYFYFTYLNWM